MLNVLFTGAQGFIGRNILPLLEGKYNFFTPSRFELDLLDEKSVREYVELHKIDVIVHSANPNPYKEAQFDKNETFLNEQICDFAEELIGNKGVITPPKSFPYIY